MSDLRKSDIRFGVYIIAICTLCIERLGLWRGLLAAFVIVTVAQIVSLLETFMRTSPKGE